MSELKYMFGPAPSRRLGRSLGINIVPSKICSLDCLYCEVGKTKATTMQIKPYIKAKDILDEFSKNYDNFKELCDVITITGAGEPTLNSELYDILKGIKSITDKEVAILTNTTTLHIESVYNTLLLFDIVVPSLDSVDELSFHNINLPDKNIKIENIISSLEKFSHEYKGRLFVEVLFCKGVNDDEKSIEKLINVLSNVKAEKVQLGTIHRPPAYENIEKVDDEFLLTTANLLKKHNINAEVTGGFSSVYKTSASLNLHDLIPSLLKMRPCTLLDITCVFGKSEKEIETSLNMLLSQGIIKAVDYNNDTYYTL